MPELLDCPICGGVDTKGILKIPDEFAPEERTFHLVQCNNCHLFRTEPRLSVQELEPYYATGYWLQSGEDQTKESWLGNLEQSFVNFQIRLGIRPLRKWIAQGATILDVGCGDGETMDVMAATGYTPYGIEPSVEAVEHVRKKHGDKVYCGTLDSVQLDANLFDAVTFFQVLEHVQNPRETLKEAYRVIKPGGIVLVEVPNIESLIFKLAKDKWIGLDMPRHLYHFSEQTLSSILTDVGFKPIEQRQFSFRIGPAGPVVALFPSLYPRTLRQTERNNFIKKFIYLALFLGATPLVLATAFIRRGETLTIIAVKPSN